MCELKERRQTRIREKKKTARPDEKQGTKESPKGRGYFKEHVINSLRCYKVKSNVI